MSIPVSLGILRQIGLFSELTDSELEFLAVQLQEKRVEKDERLFSEGDKGDALFVIEDGSFDVIIEVGEGRTAVIANLEKGQTVGEMSIIDGLPRSATIAAAEDSRVFALTKGRFDEILDQNPTVGVRLLKGVARHLCNNVREANETLSDFLED